jgi:hypothetical protein
LFTVQASAVTVVKQAVEGTLGLPVHYVVIDLDGFSDLVDALGGVTIRITRTDPDRIGRRASRARSAQARRLRGALVRPVAH